MIFNSKKKILYIFKLRNKTEIIKIKRESVFCFVFFYNKYCSYTNVKFLLRKL